MQVNIGQKIRELRTKCGRTQTELAELLGVSPQAVSRWEIGTTYPDLELLPSIANCFGVSIDQLFGYQSERDAKINAIIEEAKKLAVYDDGQDVNIEKRLTLLREGLAEFPGNEKLMYELASTLFNAGYARVGEYIYYDDDVYLIHRVNKNLENPYWDEAVKLYETVLAETKDEALRNDTAYALILLYANRGEYDKGLALAEKMPPIALSREVMSMYASDGLARHRRGCAALATLADRFAYIMVQTLMSKKPYFDSDTPVRMLNGTIAIFDLLFDDGNMGFCHTTVSELFLYLSEHQWRCGMHDEAFASLDHALEHAKAYNALLESTDEDPTYTSSFMNNVSMEKERWAHIRTTPKLPDDWPMWMMPDFDDVYAEMSADPRWADWVKRAKEI